MTDNVEAGRGNVVAARAAAFRAAVARMGGPTLPEDASVASLDHLWAWFLKRHRLPSRSTQADLQRAGSLPDWYPLRPQPAMELGPELVLLLDGLAAYVALLLQVMAPGARWIREKDPWFREPIGKLDLPGRRPVPVDVVVVDLGYMALKGDEIARRPEALRDLVDRCLSVGDPRMRLFESLTRTEAQELLSAVADGQRQRIEDLRAAVQRARGPAESLDERVDSLLPLWRWFTKLNKPKRPAMDLEIRSRGEPWWYDFWPHYGQLLGPELAVLGTGLADYLAACIQRTVPGSAWALGTDRLADLRQPVLRVGQHVSFAVHETVLRLIVGALSGDKRSRQAEALLTLAQRWIAAAPAEAIQAAAADEPYRVVVIRGEPFDYQVTLLPEVAHDDATVGSFLTALRSVDRVERAVHEDREVILVSSRLADADFREAVRLAWTKAAGGRSRSG